MPAPRCALLWISCSWPNAVSAAPAPGGEKSAPVTRARDFSRAAEFARAARRAWFRWRAWPRLPSPRELPGRPPRKPLRAVAEFVVQPRGAGDNLFVSEAEDRALRHGRENLFATSALQGFEIGHSSRVAQCRPPRERIEDCSASDRDHRGKLPQDETVPAQHEDFVLQLQIREGAAAGLPFPFPVKKNLSDGFLGPRVKMNARSVLHFSPRS